MLIANFCLFLISFRMYVLWQTQHGHHGRTIVRNVTSERRREPVSFFTIVKQYTRVINVSRILENVWIYTAINEFSVGFGIRNTICHIACAAYCSVFTFPGEQVYSLLPSQLLLFFTILKLTVKWLTVFRLSLSTPHYYFHIFVIAFSYIYSTNYFINRVLGPSLPAFLSIFFDYRCYS